MTLIATRHKYYINRDTLASWIPSVSDPCSYMCPCLTRVVANKKTSSLPHTFIQLCFHAILRFYDRSPTSYHTIIEQKLWMYLWMVSLWSPHLLIFNSSMAQNLFRNTYGTGKNMSLWYSSIGGDWLWWICHHRIASFCSCSSWLFFNKHIQLSIFKILKSFWV